MGSVLDAHGSNCPFDKAVKQLNEINTVHAASLNAFSMIGLSLLG